MTVKHLAHVDRAARAADPRPSEAQRSAGNYAKGHLRWKGLDLSIENPRGSTRSGKDADGKAWSAKMPDHYGYIKRTEGADGDHVDVYLGRDLESDVVFVVHQHDLETRKFDEHKVMLGYPSRRQAMKAYEAAFSDGKGARRVGKVEPMRVSEFKEWLASGNRKGYARGGAVAREFAEHDKTDGAGESHMQTGGGVVPRRHYADGGVMSPLGQQPSPFAYQPPGGFQGFTGTAVSPGYSGGGQPQGFPQQFGGLGRAAMPQQSMFFAGNAPPSLTAGGFSTGGASPGMGFQTGGASPGQGFAQSFLGGVNRLSGGALANAGVPGLGGVAPQPAPMPQAPVASRPEPMPGAFAAPQPAPQAPPMFQQQRPEPMPGAFAPQQPQPGVSMQPGGVTLRDGFNEGFAKGGRLHYDIGGSMPAPGFAQRMAARGIEMASKPASGALRSPIPGRTDKLPIDAPAGSYVLPADVVSGLPGAEGNSEAGHRILEDTFTTGPFGLKLGKGGGKSPKFPRGLRMPKARLPREKSFKFDDGGPVPEAPDDFGGFAGGAPDGGGSAHEPELVPTMMAGGEFIIPPETVAEVGGGDMDAGHEILDQFVKMVRQANVKTLSGLPAPAKK